MKNAKSAGFRWLPSYYDATRWLPDAERLAMYDAILDYGFGNEVGELPPMLKGFFCLMMPSIEKSIRFEQKQKDNSAKGGRPKKAGKAIDENPEENQEETQNEIDENPEETQNEIDENPDDNPEETQNDFDKNLAIAVDLAVAKDSAIESAIESAVESAVESEGSGGKKKRAARFTPPAVNEVRDYCQERKNSVDPQRFVDFYAAKGWRIGRERMKDWKAAVRTWERRGEDDGRDHGPRREDPPIAGIVRL